MESLNLENVHSYGQLLPRKFYQNGQSQCMSLLARSSRFHCLVILGMLLFLVRQEVHLFVQLLSEIQLEIYQLLEMGLL